MTASTTPSTPEAAAPARPRATDHPVARAAVAIGSDLFVYAGVWALVAVGLVAINLTANGVFGHVDASVWAGMSGFVPYLVLVGGLMAAVYYLPMLVVHGLTRRDIVAGAAVALVAVSLAAAVAVTALFALEHLVYGWADLAHVLPGDDSRRIYDTPDQYGLILLEGVALFVPSAVSGLLVGAGYYRSGWVLGTLFLPIALLPQAVTEMALDAGWVGAVVNEQLDRGARSTGMAVLVAAVAALVGMVGVRLLTRRIPIDHAQVALWR